MERWLWTEYGYEKADVIYTLLYRNQPGKTAYNHEELSLK